MRKMLNNLMLFESPYNKREKQHDSGENPQDVLPIIRSIHAKNSISMDCWIFSGQLYNSF